MAKKKGVSLHLGILLSILTAILISFIYSKEFQKSEYQPSLAQFSDSPVQFQEVEQALVQNFPSIPIYPGATIDDSYEKIIKGENGYEAEWYTTDSVKQVLEYYLYALPEDGWILDFIPENFNAYETQYEAHKGNQKLFLMIEVAETKENMTEIVAEFPLK